MSDGYPIALPVRVRKNATSFFSKVSQLWRGTDLSEQYCDRAERTEVRLNDIAGMHGIKTGACTRGNDVAGLEAHAPGGLVIGQPKQHIEWIAESAAAGSGPLRSPR